MVEPFSAQKYLRDIKPPFCAGCGGYAVSNTFLRAVHELGHENLRRFVFTSGIGCSSWIPSPHFLADSVHTLHGRSIPVATGIKLMRPDVDLVVFGGDGDIVGIGLSHFIHAARRNLDVLVIMINNMVYGMTGGQVAPTTPYRTRTATTPYGSFEYPLDAARLAVTAGACYVARWTTLTLNELKESIKTALKMRGFRFIEVVSQCPTAFGRRAGFEDSAEMLKWFRTNTITLNQAGRMSEEELTSKIVVGEFIKRSKPTLNETLQKSIEEARRQDAED
jgi:2-oxoglutarate ferredoxin oxidoreductase subunit beta